MQDLSAAPKTSRQIFESYWSPTTSPQQSIVLSLTTLAETFGQPLTDKAAMAYLASLSPLTKEQLILAFSRALDEARFLPVPSLLREFASIVDPVAKMAKEELFRIVAAMRGAHGPKLLDIPGRVLYGTAEKPLDAEGKLTYAPIRAPGTPFLLGRRTEAALVRLGWGVRPPELP